MKEKLKAHYLKFGPRVFVVCTVLVLITLDIINSYYLKLYWKAKDLSRVLLLTTARWQSADLSALEPSTLEEAYALMDNMFMFFLFIVLANNLFFYLFYLRKKLWAQGYVLFYTITAALFSVSFIFDDAGLGNGWLIYNLSTILVYGYLFAGVKVTKLETTLEDGKKGR